MHAIQSVYGCRTFVRYVSTHQHYYTLLHTGKQFSARRYKFSEDKLIVNDCKNYRSSLKFIYEFVFGKE